jgi:hypothetical protein
MAEVSLVEGLCLVCATPSPEGVLVFVHVRRGVRVELEGSLCETCGNAMEKSLRRSLFRSKMKTSRLVFPKFKTEKDVCSRARGAQT